MFLFLLLSPYIEAVDEYVPAPGQFINTLPAYEEGDDAETMARKCSEAIAGNAGGMICLGAWGGYVTFHFDHPLVNLPGQRDLYIQGNCIDTESSSEPGIVMVSQDLNGNGMPDDLWYEISGSADQDSLGLVCYNYEVTYDSLSWTDNQGNAGTVERNAFHSQPYFPLWLQSPLTFRGTRLPDNGQNQGSPQKPYWVHHPLRYGYADNCANQDTLGCSIDLSWAVDPQLRTPVHITHVDFVRVYSACLQQCGWLGETSTEICGAQDLHPEATMADASIQPLAAEEQRRWRYDLWGRPLPNDARQTNNSFYILY